MVRLVLFDIDGTLIASGGAGVRAFAAVARTAFERPEGMSRIRFAGRTDYSILREFFVAHGIDPSPERFARFLEDYVFWLDHYLHELPGRVLPGVWETLRSLQALRQPPLLGLLTGNIRLGAELKLRHYGLWQEFAVGAFSDDHEQRARIAAIARDRGTRMLASALMPEEVLVIGDTPHDIDCARAIGALSLAVATGGTSEAALREHAPTWTVSTLAEFDAAALC